MTELDMYNKQSSIPCPSFQPRRRRPTYQAFEVLRRRKLQRDGDTETIPNSLSHTNTKKQNIHSLSLNHWRRPTRFWIFKKMKTTQRWMGAQRERERERERDTESDSAAIEEVDPHGCNDNKSPNKHK
jgi:hypothetical protein